MEEKEATEKPAAINAKGIFAAETIAMGIILSLMAWGGLQIVGSKEAIAKSQEQFKALEINAKLTTKTHAAVIRMEISQELYNNYIKKEMLQLNDSIEKLEEKIN